MDQIEQIIENYFNDDLESIFYDIPDETLEEFEESLIQDIEKIKEN